MALPGNTLLAADWLFCGPMRARLSPRQVIVMGVFACWTGHAGQRTGKNPLMFSRYITLLNQNENFSTFQLSFVESKTIPVD